MHKHNSKLLLITIFAASLACTDDGGTESTTNGNDGSSDSTASDATSAEGGSESNSGSGDGDGDPTTGDGDPSTGDGDGDPGTGDGDGEPACEGQHPELDGENRYCLEGWCGCGLGLDGFDVCYMEGEAEACCPQDIELLCPAPNCQGQHPEVNGDNRFCLDGFCGCGLGIQGFDVCYPADIAADCCMGDVPLDCP